MKEIVFLNKDQILHLHKKQIMDYGGLVGIRDLGLLESAIAQPSVSFGGEYLHHSIFLMAAAYFYHISQNQPFIDGNKRTGFLCMYTFLKLNGHTYIASNEITYPYLLAVAENKKSKEELANFIQQYSISLS